MSALRDRTLLRLQRLRDDAARLHGELNALIAELQNPTPPSTKPVETSRNQSKPVETTPNNYPPRAPARRFTPSAGYPSKPRKKGAYQSTQARRGPARAIEELCPDCAFPPGICQRHGRGAA